MPQLFDTIVSAIPAFFAWLDGRQTHVVTPNEYLAARDREQLKPALELLGASVTLLSKGHQVARKQAAYRGDVVYDPADVEGSLILKIDKDRLD